MIFLRVHLILIVDLIVAKPTSIVSTLAELVRALQLACPEVVFTAEIARLLDNFLVVRVVDLLLLTFTPFSTLLPKVIGTRNIFPLLLLVVRLVCSCLVLSHILIGFLFLFLRLWLILQVCLVLAFFWLSFHGSTCGLVLSDQSLVNDSCDDRAKYECEDD